MKKMDNVDTTVTQKEREDSLRLDELYQTLKKINRLDRGSRLGQTGVTNCSATKEVQENGSFADCDNNDVIENTSSIAPAAARYDPSKDHDGGDSETVTRPNNYVDVDEKRVEISLVAAQAVTSDDGLHNILENLWHFPDLHLNKDLKIILGMYEAAKEDRAAFGGSVPFNPSTEGGCTKQEFAEILASIQISNGMSNNALLDLMSAVKNEAPNLNFPISLVGNGSGRYKLDQASYVKCDSRRYKVSELFHVPLLDY